MKSKTLYIIIAVLVVGILAVVFLNNNNQTNISSAEGYSLPAVQSEDVETIKIETALDEFEIKRTASGWTVGDKAADSSRINNFLNSLSTVDIKGLVGTSEENYGRFSVDKIGGTDVTLLGSQNKELLHIIIGKAGSDYSSTYFRPYSGKNVYTARSSWSTSVFKTINDWRDKTAWSFAEGEVKKIIVKQGWKTYQASFDEEKWVIEHNGRTRTAENFGDKVLSISASGFSDEEMPLDDSIVFYGEGDTELLAFNVGSDDTRYYISNDSLGDEFTFSKSAFEQFWLPAVFEKIKE